MKSLFWRIFVLSWIAMTVVGVGFSLLVASTFASERAERRVAFIKNLARQGADVVAVRARDGDEAAEAKLKLMTWDVDDQLWLLQGGEVKVGQEPPADDLGVVRAVAEKATADSFIEQTPEEERFAIRVGDGDWTLVGWNKRQSLASRVFEREVQRSVLIIVVAGLLSLALARYLSRPLLQLREASARIAQGDLTVRVTPELKGASTELLALGRDFDAMAERLEAILESQKRLLRDVSHELRSPLARLGVALELARQRAGEAAQPPLDRIERDSLRLGALISEILQLTRLDAGEPGTKAEPMALADVADLVRGVAADVDFEAKPRNRSVVVDTDALGPAGAPAMNGNGRLMGRPELLRRAIENVLRNAARFTAENTVVECKVTRRNGTLELRVRDHGPGVPAEALGDIFRPFFRVESARDRETGGAGLGLAIVERAVKLHGGTVHAENAAGGGLEVVMRFPVVS